MASASDFPPTEQMNQLSLLTHSPDAYSFIIGIGKGTGFVLDDKQRIGITAYHALLDQTNVPS